MPKTVAPKKVRKPKLGQHFLIDDEAARKIVEAAGDVSERTVLEIGPGRGVLTSMLAKRARRVIAVETDRVLAAQLRMAFGLSPNVEIIEGDILTIDLDTLFGPKPGLSRPGLEWHAEGVRVIGNLPYFITSDILLRLFSYRKYFDLITLMVQREVADRLAAKPGNSEYGLLSATAQLYAEVETLFTLPPSAFSPPPKVYSSVIRLRLAPKVDALKVEEGSFIQFLKVAFAQKRKTLTNNLKTAYADVDLLAVLSKAGVKESARAEELPLEKMAALYRGLQ